MQVFCTFHFYNQITTLQKKNNYANIIADICEYFSNKNIEELHQTKDLLVHVPGVYSLNKYRIPNSSTGVGKSGSYRCICACTVKDNKVYLDYIYPKTGSEGIENLTKQTYKNIAKNISSSISESKIYTIDLAKRQFKKLEPKVKAAKIK